MADLITFTDLALYMGAITFNANEQSTATLVCGAVSDSVRSSVNRTFEIQTAAQDRYFTAQRPFGSNLINLAYWYPWPSVYPSLFSSVIPTPMLMVDDFFLTGQTLNQITVTDVAQPTVTYTPTQTWPFNAGTQGNPYTALMFAAGTFLPLSEGGLKVNAKWGYVTAIPTGVKEAALIQAQRWFTRRGQPGDSGGSSGMQNATQLYPTRRLDPDVEQMLTAYRRWYAAA